MLNQTADYQQEVEFIRAVMQGKTDAVTMIAHGGRAALLEQKDSYIAQLNSGNLNHNEIMGRATGFFQVFIERRANNVL